MWWPSYHQCSICYCNLGLKIDVLAEGVETEEQYEFLKNNGCDYIQGYYFYRPMTADDVEKLLKAEYENYKLQR
jgi:EAL domain-containing protein (putative c-di-GMP-specific phosphodiesterase class I)